MEMTSLEQLQAAHKGPSGAREHTANKVCIATCSRMPQTVHHDVVMLAVSCADAERLCSSCCYVLFCSSVAQADRLAGMLSALFTQCETHQESTSCLETQKDDAEMCKYALKCK